MFFKKLTLSALFVLAISGVSQNATAYADVGVERQNQIRTAMVFNFVRFAEWPKRESNTDLVLCYSTDIDIQKELADLNGQNVNGRILRVRPLKADALESCDLSYLSKGDAESPLARDLLDSGSLTVSSQSGFVNSGVIELVSIGRQLRFKINNTNAKRASVSLSSKLLRLAVEVQ